MEGEEEASESEGAFNKASILKRIAIVSAGALVNIIFGFIVYFILIAVMYQSITLALTATASYSGALVESVKLIFTGNVGVNDLTGPVGISNLISATSGIAEYVYMISVISVSLGITNLLPIPALDGGKILLLIIEAIRKKPLKENTEIQIQLIGFSLLIALSVLVTYNDVIRVLGG